MHRRIYISFFFLTAAMTSFAQSANDSIFDQSVLHGISLLNISNDKLVALGTTPPGMTRLFVFLSPECPICQNYTMVLNELQSRYAGKILFYGIFPGKAYKPAEVRSFRKKYKIGYSLLIDGSLRLSRYLQASTTPEVILLDSKNELIYKGAIDNRYKSLGKARIRTTENYLQDAIDHTLHKEIPSLKRTSPVGCLLNDF